MSLDSRPNPRDLVAHTVEPSPEDCFKVSRNSEELTCRSLSRRDEACPLGKLAEDVSSQITYFPPFKREYITNGVSSQWRHGIFCLSPNHFKAKIRRIESAREKQNPTPNPPGRPDRIPSAPRRGGGRSRRGRIDPTPRERVGIPGPARCPFTNLFGGTGSPTKIDYRQKLVPLFWFPSLPNFFGWEIRFPYEIDYRSKLVALF